jgi:hypothetical protein
MVEVSSLAVKMHRHQHFMPLCREKQRQVRKCSWTPQCVPHIRVAIPTVHNLKCLDVRRP